MRHFENPYDDYNGSEVYVDKDKIKSLIQRYVKDILNSDYKNGKK